jgi:hypothetical protein
MTKRQFLISLALITVFSVLGGIVGGTQTNPAYAQSQTVLSGIPLVKISEGGFVQSPIGKDIIRQITKKPKP